MADNPLQHRYKILAGTNNHEDLLKTLEVLSDCVADVRFPIPAIKPEQDNVQLRAAVAAILKDAIDTVRRIRKNYYQRPGDSEESSDDSS